MTGTPSQIEWANQIKPRVNAEFDRVSKALKGAASKQAEHNRLDTLAVIAILEEKRVEVMAKDQAGYFIRDWQELKDQVRQMITQDSRYQAIGSESGASAMNKLNQVEAIMNIRPLYDRIVVKRIEEQETTQNGIIIPDSAKEKPQEGEVVAVGRGKRLDDGKLSELEVKAGDRILFGKYSGSDTKVNGTEYIIMREDDVLAVFNKKVD